MSMLCLRMAAAPLLLLTVDVVPAHAQDCRTLASMETLGSGTSGTGGVPALQPLGAPMVGEPGMGLRITHGLPSAAAFIVAGAPTQPTRLPAYGALLHVGPPLARFPVRLGPDGISAALHTGPAAADPALCGLEFVAQGMVADGAAQGGLAFTAALHLRFGEGAAAAGLFLGMGAAVPTALDGFLAAGIDLADLDGNGRLDVVAPAAAGPDSSVSVLLQLDDGSLWSAARWPAGGSQPSAVVLADLDGDGLDDAAVCNRYDFGSSLPLTGNLAVLRGLGGRSFAAPEPHAIAGQPNAIVAADLDGDGRLELVCTDDDNPVLIVLPNTGGGTFGAPLTWPLPGLSKERALDAADLDGDGLADLLVRRSVGPVDEVVVFRSLGGLSFALPQSVPLDAYSSSGAALGDLDGDLDPDLVVSMTANSFTEGGVRVLLNTGGQLGAATPLGPAGSALGLQIADLDGDGDADVLVQQGVGAFVLEQAGGQFARTVALDVAGLARAVDMNQDGLPDLVSRRTAVSGTVGWVGWIANRGELRFALPPSIAGFAPTESELVDLDGDGLPDLVGNTAQATVAVVLGQGAQGFGPAAAYDAGGIVRTLAVGDLDRDGRPDLVVTHASTASVAVLRGVGGGAFGVPTVIALAGAQRVRLADANADGHLDALVSRFPSPPGPALGVLLGVGDGSLQSPLLTGPSSFMSPFAAGDVDEDGFTDVVWHTWVGVWLTRGAGDGSFGAAEIILPDGNMTDPSALADLDGDNHLDLVVPLSNTLVRVLKGNGDGHFVPIGVFPASFRERLDVVDVNGDGALDLVGTGVALGFGDGTFAPYQPGDVGGPLGDLDGDGDLDGCAHGRLFLNALH